MSLGLARDSSLDLASLAAEKNERRLEDSLTSTNESSSHHLEEGDVTVKSVGLPRDPLQLNLASLQRRTSSTESVKEDESVESLSSGLSDTKLDDKEVNGNAGQYAGFNADFSDYEGYGVEYNVDPYAPSIFGEKKREGGGFFCCLFAPWFGSKQPDKIEEQYEEKAEVEKKSSSDEEEVSLTGSEMYGEKLSAQERMAAIARLRVSEIDPAHVDDSSTSATGTGLLKPAPATDTNQFGLELEKPPEEAPQDEKPQDAPKKVKGILKRGSSSKSADKLTKSPPSGGAAAEAGRRRSLFTTTYEQKPHTKKHARFAPMARVVTVKSCNEMTFLEKSLIWWQKTDYDSFKKSGRLIAKAMLEGGSEIWLANSSRDLKKHQRKSSADGKRSFHLSDRAELRQEPGDEADQEDYGNKWWCKFGHSRRGLEHIASMEEGRQRQANVRAAIRAVLEEQRKQKIYDRQDSDKLRRIGLQHTSWARDLALAAGAADAESVRSNFSDSSKSRAFYLQKQASASVGTARQVPDFMDPRSVSPQKLDANTSSQIRFRRKSSGKIAPAPMTKEKKPEEQATMEAIHDPVHSSIARKAAAFGTETKDMAAVLSGMGAVSGAERDVEHTPQRTSVGAH